MTDVDYCVVGAGFAGLTAALRLTQAGPSVALLEARDRVGGRTFTEVREDGSWIDRGGAWVGPGQDRIYALMDEFGVKSYKQYTDGEAMMVVDGKQYRYKGTIPAVVESVGGRESRHRVLRTRRDVQDDSARGAVGGEEGNEVGSILPRQWLGPTTRCPTAAHDLLETAIAGCYTSAASEVSMLFVLYQMASGGGPEFRPRCRRTPPQDARPVGGMGAVYRRWRRDRLTRSTCTSRPGHRARRRRRDRLLRGSDRARPGVDRRGPPRDREPDHL